MTDVDAVTERLNGLVNLLHVVGIDGVDPDALVEEQKKLSSQKGSSNSTPTTQSSDSQILEIIRKLQQAQADSPEILAALKSPELRALASLAAQRQPKPEPKKQPAPSLDDVMDDDDNYPKIGPGYSDDISVVSDLTTPTVMTKQHVAEEEYYKDVNGGPGSMPPMQIGMGPAQPSRPTGAVPGAVGANHGPKKKNLVSQVTPASSRRAIAKTGGAAAQRRLNYQQAMAKLQSNDYGTPVAAKKDPNYMENFSPKKPPAAFFPSSPTLSKLPSELPSLADQGKKLKQTRNKNAVKEKKGRKTALAAQEEADFELDSDPMAPKFDQVPESGASGNSAQVKKKKNVSQGIEWGSSQADDTSGWPAFDDMAPSKSGDNNLFVDSDGFFSSDVFSSNGADPFSSSKSPRSKREEGQPAKPRKPKKEGEISSDRSSSKRDKDKDKGKKTKSRRASLTM